MESVALAGVEHLEAAAPDFGAIVEQYKRRIYYLALDLTGNHHDAEDLAQEAFLKAYKALKRFRGDAQVGTWIYRITVNTHIDRQRGKAAAALRSQASLDDDEKAMPTPIERNPGRNPERILASANIQEQIGKALERLSPQQRTIFVLRHYQDMKLKEIAAVLNRSEGTIKTTLFRAIRRLQNELSAYRPELGLEETS